MAFTHTHTLMDPLYAYDTSSAAPVLAVFSPLDHGWRCRSTARGRLQHDYTSDESIDVLHNWLQAELGPTVVTTFDREEALAYLSILLASEDGATDPSFLFHGAMCGAQAPWTAENAEERVLRHLERGW